MPNRSHKGKVIVIFIVTALIAAAGIGIRMHDAWALKKETEETAVTPVTVIAAKKLAPEEEIVLPGNVQAWHEATIYARTNGYVKKWYTPMGTTVKEGELLAEIETPEVDAQLRQAEADLKTAEANNTLSQLTANRWKELLKTDSVSKQEEAEKEGDAMAKAAALASAKANRDHLRELASFKSVVAPFDGVISSRTTDIGMLVSAGSTTEQPLFHIVQADTLRIYIRVPQAYAGRITPDVKAELHFIDRPGKTYTAEFVKTAEALDPTNRTLLTEYKVENKNNELLAGGYAEVHMKLPTPEGGLHLPVNALIFREGGLQVAVVDDKNHAQLKTVTMGRDMGNVVEISSGLNPADRIVINPPDSLSSGQEVRVVEAKVEPAKDGKSEPVKADAAKDTKSEVAKDTKKP